MDAWARRGQALRAAEVLEALEKEAPVDRYAFTAAISGLAEARELQRAQELLRPEHDAAVPWLLKAGRGWEKQWKSNVKASIMPCEAAIWELVAARIAFQTWLDLHQGLQRAAERPHTEWCVSAHVALAHENSARPAERDHLRHHPWRLGKG